MFRNAKITTQTKRLPQKHECLKQKLSIQSQCTARYRKFEKVQGCKHKVYNSKNLQNDLRLEILSKRRRKH